MCAHFLVPASQFQVIIQAVLLFRGVLDISAIADCSLDDFSGFPDRIDGDLHVFRPVKAVEYPEYVNSRIGCLLYKKPDHVIRIIFVTHGIRCTQ